MRNTSNVKLTSIPENCRRELEALQVDGRLHLYGPIKEGFVRLILTKPLGVVHVLRQPHRYTNVTVSRFEVVPNAGKLPGKTALAATETKVGREVEDVRYSVEVLHPDIPIPPSRMQSHVVPLAVVLVIAVGRTVHLFHSLIVGRHRWVMFETFEPRDAGQLSLEEMGDQRGSKQVKV